MFSFFVCSLYCVTPQVALFSAPIFAADTVEDHLRTLNGSLPIYKPPKENAPHSRIEGGTRGGKSNEPGVIALVPDHVGFTIRKILLSIGTFRSRLLCQCDSL